jgi:hypothetical protein
VGGEIVPAIERLKNEIDFYQPGHVGVNTKGMLIALNQCGGTRIKTSTAGPVTTTSGKFSFLEDGVLIGARGHLHDGGVAMQLFINGKHLCDSKAGYGGEGASTNVNGQQWEVLSSMTYCDGPFPVKRGDELSMASVYDLKKHPLRKGSSGAEASGVMAMFSLAFAPGK